MSDTEDREWLDTLAGQIARARAPEAAHAQTADPTIDAAALEGNPFDRKGPTWRTAMRATGARGLTAVALALGVLLLGWHLSPKTSNPDSARGLSVDGIARLEAADPNALRRQIVAELGSVGVEANGYAQLGVDGVDADLPLPVSADVQRVLASHRVPAPANGALRIEIASSKNR